ncbi:MAG: ABC transporter ATP-binding protein [Planctomycetota bacterium]|jgi:ABC-type lipoprotein export system ATPase subunit
MIHVKGLDFSYLKGEFRLEVPELSIAQGQKAAVIGPSGSGKTTLLHLLAGIIVPQAGSVTIQDVELSGLSDIARRDFRISRIGLVFQEFELLEYLDVLDNILLPYRITGALDLNREVRERAAELAAQVGIGDKLRRNILKLSQGEKQRVAVCRALLPDPPLLFTDEPTGNLDPGNKGRVLDILLEYARKNSATLVTVTHDHDLIDRFDRVIDFQEFHTLPAEAAGGGNS